MIDGLAAAPTWYWAVVAGLLGLCFGSFATVAASRWPRGESLLRPGSHCPSCEHRLRPHELVPVASFLAQRGRCRSCATSIGWRYPVIELACGALGAAAVLTFGATWQGAAAAVLAVVLVPVVAIDLEHQLIPDILVLPAAAIGLFAAIASDPARWWVAVASALGAAAFLFVLWIAHPGGMGLGDVKLALLMGAVLGASVIPALFVAFALGGLLGVVLLARFGGRARKMAVPFGPFMAAGALVALWWGPPMIGWYLDSFAL